MEKIFFMCTHCNQGTGYGRGACKIADEMKIIFPGINNE
jgi:primosomal protein N'